MPPEMKQRPSRLGTCNSAKALQHNRNTRRGRGGDYTSSIPKPILWVCGQVITHFQVNSSTGCLRHAYECHAFRSECFQVQNGLAAHARPIFVLRSPETQLLA
jgi:hypothetical protein